MAAPAVAAHQEHQGPRLGAPPGLYRPRRPRESPLHGLLERRFRHLSLVYDERFAPTYGPWRAVVPAVVTRPTGPRPAPRPWTRPCSSPGS
jgi:hypothetical protein